MPDGKIRREDILSDDAVKALQDLSNAINGVTNSIKELMDTEKKLKSQIDKNNDAQVELSKTTKKLSDIQKTKAKINALETKEGKELTREQIKLREARKKARIEAEKQLGLTKQQTSFTKKMANAYKLATIQILAVFGAMKGGIKIMRNIIMSIQSTGDAFVNNLRGMKESVNALFRSIATGDWSNLIDKMREAFKVGRQYSEMLDDLGDRLRAMSLTEADAKKRLVELLQVARDNMRTNEERINAINEFIEKEIELQDKRVENAQLALDAEKNIAAQRAGIASEEILMFLKNYDIWETKVADAQQITEEFGKRLRSGAIAWEEIIRGDPVSEEASRILQINEAVIQLDDDIRKKLTDAYIKLRQQEVSAAENTMRLFTLRSSLLEELTRVSLASDKAMIQSTKTLNEELLREMDTFHQEFIESNDMLYEELLNDMSEYDAVLSEQIRKEVEERKKAEQDKQNAIQETINLSTDAINSAFNLTSSIYAREEEMVIRRYDNEIAAAEKAGKDTEEIEKRKAIEIAKINRKQAILNKAASLFDIAVNTAVAATKVTAQTGIGAVIAVPLVIAAGALQAAAVIAEPLPEIPSFMDGGDLKKGGLAEIHGGELINTDKGQFFTNWDKKEGRILDLPKSEIIPNDLVKKDLANLTGNTISFNGGMSTDEFKKINQQSTSQIVNSINSIKITNVTHKGIETISKNGRKRSLKITERYRT